MNVPNETFGAEEKNAEKTAEKIAAPKKKKSRLHKNTPGDIAIIACLLIFSALTFYPLWYVLIGSVSDGQDYLKGGVYFLPRIFTFESYKTIFANERIWNGLVITLFRCAVGPVSSVLFTSFVAYGMSRKNLRWRKFFNVWALIPMFFGGGLIPYVNNMKLPLTIYSSDAYMITAGLIDPTRSDYSELVKIDNQMNTIWSQSVLSMIQAKSPEEVETVFKNGRKRLTSKGHDKLFDARAEVYAQKKSSQGIAWGYPHRDPNYKNAVISEYYTWERNGKTYRDIFGAIGDVSYYIDYELIG